MAKAPTPSHYTITVARPFFHGGMQYNPGPTTKFMVKAAVLAAIKAEIGEDAIKSESPLFKD